MSEQVKVVALYDTVGYKPQHALDGTDPLIRRATEYFDKGEERAIPKAEFDRLTDPKLFPDGPAVAKAGGKTSAAASETSPEQVPLGGAVPQELAGTPFEPHSVPGGATPDATSSDLEARLDALRVAELQKLVKDNNVTVSSDARKPDYVKALAAAGVQPE